MPGSAAPKAKGKLTKENKAALKKTAKSFATKFGPIIFAGVAAAVKHHLDDDEERRDAAEAPPKARSQIDDKASDKTTDSELRREIRHLKRSMRRKEKEFLHVGSARSASEAPSVNSMRVNIPKITVQDHDNDHHNTPPSVKGFEQEGSFERKTPMNDYYQYPEDQFSTAEQSEKGSSEEAVIATREVDKDDFHKPRHHRHHRHHHHDHLIHHPHLRNSSLPIRLPSKAREEVLQAKAIEASKVAALTGAVEALLLTDYHGKWWENGPGPKGKRVGTAVAAGFRTSWARGEKPDSDGWEMAANVGRGLLVTRIMHGSSRRIEKEWRDERRGRRRRRDSF